MAVDDRILYLVREEVGKVMNPPDVSGTLDELHTELHALATKVTALETRLTALEAAGKTVPSRAPRAVKAPDA